MQRHSPLLIALLFSFSSGLAQVHSSGTVIIATKTKNAIYVGADSRVTMYGSVRNDSTQMCKIVRTKLFNVAVQGLNVLAAATLVKQIADTAKSYDTFKMAYAKAMVDYFNNHLPFLRTANFKLFQFFQDEYKYSLHQLVVFGIVADTLMLKAIIIKSNFSNFGSIEVSAHEATDNRYACGHIDEIKTSLKDDNYWKAGPIPTINKAMKLAAKHHPVEVGGPIDILVVTKTRTYWAQRKKLCND